MNKNVHLNLIFQIIAILSICTIECGFKIPKVEHKAFVTHCRNDFKNCGIGSTIATNLPFDPGGLRTTEEHLEDLRKVFLFNVAHKLKDGRKLLDLYTVPLSKQKLALEHFDSYFENGYSSKAKQLEEIISKFESNKNETGETVRSIQDVFLSEVLGKYEYKENIGDAEALSRQVDLMYSADLMASYILLFTRKMIRSLLYKYIWTNFAFLDSSKQYLCCNWIVNGGVHDEELHKKFSLEELTNQDLVNIIRLHKNYLSFVKVKSRRVLSMLDRSSLLSTFQTILMRSIWAHYVHEPSSLSIEKPSDEQIEQEKSEEYVNLIKAESECQPPEPGKGEEHGHQQDEQGYLDNIYEWMIRYKNKINSSKNVRGVNYLNSEEFNQLKETLNTLERLYAESAPKPEYKSTKSGRVRIKTDEDSKRKELRQNLKVLIEYYRDHLTTINGIYGKIEENENLVFLNNLTNYNKDELLNLVVVYLSALPELKQIRSKQMYLHYMTLNRITLVKLLYVSMLRTNRAFVPLINHFYSYDFNYLDEQKRKNLEEKMMSERKEIIYKSNFTLETVASSNEDRRIEREDVLIFELDELEGLIDMNARVNRNMQRKWTRINGESKQVVTLGTRRTDEVMRSILKHPPHYNIVIKVLNENEYENEKIKENITYLNGNYSTKVGESDKKTEESVAGGSEENVYKMIRNKKVELILSLMSGSELKRTYNQFLQYVYPFNTMNASEEYKQYLGDQELGDEEVQVENENIFGNLRGEVNEETINQMIYKYDQAQQNREFATLRESILSYFSRVLGVDKDVEVGVNLYSSAGGDSGDVGNFEQIIKMSEKKDIELIDEAKKHVRKLEEDPNTLRIKIDNVRRSGGRANVFTILPSGKKDTYRNMTLKGMEGDGEITYFDDYIDCSDDESDKEVDESAEGWEVMDLNGGNNEYGLDKDRKAGNEGDGDAFEVNNVIIRRKKELPRSSSSHVFYDRPGERVEKLEFGEDQLQNWTKLGLNSNVANTAVSYITHLYKGLGINRIMDRAHETDIYRSSNGADGHNKDQVIDKIDTDDSYGNDGNYFIDGNYGKDVMDGKDVVDSLDNMSNVDSMSNFDMSKSGKSSGVDRITVENRKIVQPLIRPSLIQILSIPKMLKKDRKNMIICGASGSGKTLAYMLPILQVLKEHERWKLREPSSPRCVILVPTSELCDQIGKVVKELAHMVKLSSATISKSCTPKVIKSKLKGLVDVVVAMPSKLLKYRNCVKLNRLKYLVIEEADCMLNEGFFPQVYSILQQIGNYSKLGRDKNSRDERREVQIVQVASNINYLKFFESIQSSFSKFLHRNSIVDAAKWRKKRSAKSEDELGMTGPESSEATKDEEYTVNLAKLFGKNKKRIELYKHILDYYFSPLNRRKNDTFVYNKRIIEDIVGSEKVIDEIGITRPPKGIRHMFMPSNNEKVRTLINLLKYDLKYECGGNEKVEACNGTSVSKSSSKEREDDRKIIIFCRKVKAVIAIDYYLNEAGYRPISIHSEMPFKMRKSNFKQFKSGRSSILITTELMSRGLNLDVDVVVLFDFPLNANEYIRKSSLLVHTPFLNGGSIQESEIASGASQKQPWVNRPRKVCIGLIDKKDVVLSEAIKRSLMVDYFPLNKLSSRRSDYNHLTGRLKYLTQAGCYFKFLSYLRELKIEGVFDGEHMYKYLDKFREIVKTQFINSFKKVRLRRVRICKKRRELMKKLKLLKKWNRAIRLKQRIISELDRKKREKDYIYVGLTKDQRSCPPMKDLKKVRYELLKLKLLKGSNSEKILKRSQNQIYKFINRLQMKLVDRNHLLASLCDKYGASMLNDMKSRTQQVSIFEQVKNKLELIRSEDRNKNVRRICSLI